MDDALVLGIGNVLWADEGFGVRCVETFDANWSLPPGVQSLDGGTQGLYLLPFLQATRRLIIFDAIDFGLEPGTLRVLEGTDVPRYLGVRKTSLHQTGFQEVLALAALTGTLPDPIVLLGVQPVELDDYGGSLRPAVLAQIPVAIDIAIARLTEWGLAPTRRTTPEHTESPLGRQRYEAERPSAVSACRVGDARFLPPGD
jgi:hydrogenase maturation protease